MEICGDHSGRLQRTLGTRQRKTLPFPLLPARGTRPASKVVKTPSWPAAEAKGIGMGVARVSSLPLEAVLGTAGRRRAGVIPTAGAGRRSQRWLRGAPAQAKEGQEVVRARGGTGRWT